jgi:tetratricopeptide (TPR) repeat protein
VSTPAQRSARVALDAARPAVARLDSTRGAEDLAADLIESWGAVETALRTLVGSSVLTGQPLIREARQRQMINFDQANALAEFQAVHDRLQNTSYRATDADVASAKSAFAKLDAGLAGDTVGEPLRPAPAAPAFGAPAPAEVKTMPVADAGPVKVVRPPARLPVWMLALIILVVVGGVGLYLALGRGGGGGSLQQGIDAYRKGQREVAVSAFSKAAREDPKSATPHVYLARMAREVGNFTLSTQELQLALQAEPTNASALREMGANLLAQGNYELARRFYVRAIEADPTDTTSQGYLGCVLMKLNRPSDAEKFLTRAGPGPWSSCTPATPAQTPPGATGPNPTIPRD